MKTIISIVILSGGIYMGWGVRGTWESVRESPVMRALEWVKIPNLP